MSPISEVDIEWGFTDEKAKAERLAEIVPVEALVRQSDVAALISPLVAGMDAAMTSHKAARENFLTMQGAAAKLLEDANGYKATMLANYDRALTAERLLAEARAERDGLLEALNWALGCVTEFRVRADGEGAYWWRKELAERAGLTYDKDAGTYVARASIGGGNG